MAEEERTPPPLVYQSPIVQHGGEVVISAPVLVSAEIGNVNGYTVVVTYSAVVSVASDVVVKVNGIATTNDGGTIQGDAHIVYYVIPIPWHGSGDVVTVDDHAVTNNILWEGLLDLQADTGVTTSVSPFAGTGTITQSSNDVVGVGTAFQSEVVVGDVITGTGINGTVTAITDDENLTLSSSATAGEASFTITPQASTARVSAWADQSGNGYNFTQSGTARPSKQTVDGYPFITPDNRNDWMDGANFADDLSKFAVFYVGRWSGGVSGPIVTKMDVNIDWDYNGWFADESTGLAIHGGVGWNKQNKHHGSPASPESATYVRCFEKPASNAAADMHIYLNGAANDGTTSTVGSPVVSFANDQNVKLWVEGGVNGVDDYGYGRVTLAAVLIYEITSLTNWNATDRAALTTRLVERYGVTI